MEGAALLSQPTGRLSCVLRELFAEAEQRVLVAGFAVRQGREIFAALADRMRQRAELAVRLCLDVRRPPGDTTRSDALLRRFAERFVHQEWPGPRLPDLFYGGRRPALRGRSSAARISASSPFRGALDAAPRRS
jgi:hypothetical protein